MFDFNSKKKIYDKFENIQINMESIDDPIEPIKDISSSPESEETSCRICLDNDNPGDIIVPCRCNGTMKYVHRACLQEWRIQDIDSPNFKRCNQCLYEYQTFDNTSKCHLCFSNLSHFMIRNRFLLFLIIQICVIGLTYMYIAIDKTGDFIYSTFGLFHDLDPFQEAYVLGLATFIGPLFIIIVIHDIYIYHKFKLRTYFHNYAGIGLCRFIIFIGIIVVLFLIESFLGSLALSYLLESVLKHMLQNYYNSAIGESNVVIDLSNTDFV
jgi:hypothetical protein